MSPSRSPLIRALGPQDADYLRDESRLAGRADSLSFPSSEEEVREVLRATGADGTPVTVQGGRTGIVGGAVPLGGHVLNLGRMDRILDPSPDPNPNADPGRRLLRVQPGLPLVRLNEWLQSVSGGLFFPPDPTESTATLGGMACTNASGARSLAYGPMRRHVQALRLVLADGSAVALARGRNAPTAWSSAWSPTPDACWPGSCRASARRL